MGLHAVTLNFRNDRYITAEGYPQDTLPRMNTLYYTGIPEHSESEIKSLMFLHGVHIPKNIQLIEGFQDMPPRDLAKFISENFSKKIHREGFMVYLLNSELLLYLGTDRKEYQSVYLEAINDFHATSVRVPNIERLQSYTTRIEL